MGPRREPEGSGVIERERRDHLAGEREREREGEANPRREDHDGGHVERAEQAPDPAPRRRGRERRERRRPDPRHDEIRREACEADREVHERRPLRAARVASHGRVHAGLHRQPGADDEGEQGEGDLQ